MPQAFVTLVADRVEPGPLTTLPDGTVQQVTRLYMAEECVCTLLVSFPKGSPSANLAHTARTLDGMSPRLAAALPHRPAAGTELEPPAPTAWVRKTYLPGSPPRLRKPDESVTDYRVAMGWDRPHD